MLYIHIAIHRDTVYRVYIGYIEVEGYMRLSNLGSIGWWSRNRRRLHVRL